jgi:hypothetical protein
MAEFARKADGRRVFTVDFKRETVGRIVSAEWAAGATATARMSARLDIERNVRIFMNPPSFGPVLPMVVRLCEACSVRPA